jgi:hypothetical protein
LADGGEHGEDVVAVVFRLGFVVRGGGAFAPEGVYINSIGYT